MNQTTSHFDRDVADYSCTERDLSGKPINWEKLCSNVEDALRDEIDENFSLREEINYLRHVIKYLEEKVEIKSLEEKLEKKDG